MPDRPHVLLSAAMSVDGRIDDLGPQPLLLSDAADLDRVDEVRAGVDAILVGATTLRRDDPRLLVRSADRRAARVASGRAPDPIKVTLTGSGDLDPAARFFATGAGSKLVYAPTPAVVAARRAVGAVAEVVDAGEPLDLHRMLADLRSRGVARLMVEGGTAVHTLFLTSGVVDELHLVVAPFFVGDADAPRFVGPGRFPHGTGNRMRLADARPIGDLVLLRYLLDDAGV
ncbi:MAG TPA: RibD family protein [Pseudonocardia sp.]|nr:RibD family protein [Pseudonocardia sp.]